MVDVLRLLEVNGFTFSKEARRILSYADAQERGVAYVKTVQADQEKTAKEESAKDPSLRDVPAGGTYYRGAILADIFDSNNYDVLQFWNSSGEGGGNHSE
jgi:hypothetical protein